MNELNLDYENAGEFVHITCKLDEDVLVKIQLTSFYVEHGIEIRKSLELLRRKSLENHFPSDNVIPFDFELEDWSQIARFAITGLGKVVE